MATQSRMINKRENDIHGYEKRLLQVYKLLERDLSAENFQLIKKYDQMFVQHSLSKAYRSRNLNAMLILTRMLNKNWVDVAKEDIDNLVYNVVQTYSDHKGKETNSTADAKKYLKMFFRWVRFGTKDFKAVGDPPETKDVKIRLVSDKLVRENLIEKGDYDRIIHACHNSRDRAMFAVQHEAGTRPGELLSMRLKHVKFDDIGAVIAVDGKTGARPVRLIKSVPYLSHWVNLDHPNKEDYESPLWPQLEGKNVGLPLNYYAARKAPEMPNTDEQMQQFIASQKRKYHTVERSMSILSEAQTESIKWMRYITVPLPEHMQWQIMLVLHQNNSEPLQLGQITEKLKADQRDDVSDVLHDMVEKKMLETIDKDNRNTKYVLSEDTKSQYFTFDSTKIGSADDIPHITKKAVSSYLQKGYFLTIADQTVKKDEDRTDLIAYSY